MVSTNTGTKSSHPVLSCDSTAGREAPPPLTHRFSTTRTDLHISDFWVAFLGFNRQNHAYWDELSPSTYDTEVALDWIYKDDPVYIKQKGKTQTAL